MKIERENIVKVPIPHEHPVFKNDIFCRTCGIPVTADDIQITYVCESCRHLVDKTDIFCSTCGEFLTDNIKKTEHYFTGVIATEHFDVIKSAIEAKKKEKANGKVL
jgi:hypothetical protein